MSLSQRIYEISSLLNEPFSKIRKIFRIRVLQEVPFPIYFASICSCSCSAIALVVQLQMEAK